MILVIPIFSNTFLLIRHTDGDLLSNHIQCYNSSKCSKHQWLPLSAIYLSLLLPKILIPQMPLFSGKAVLSPGEVH